MDADTKEAVASKAQSQSQSQEDSALAHLPVGLFGSATGIGGLGGAWRLAHQYLGLPAWPSQVLAALSLLAFVAMLIAYVAKAITAPEAVRAEFAHPVSGSLFGLIPIALMLLPVPLVPLAPQLAIGLWVTGAILCLAFAAYTLFRWMSARQQVEMALPAWIIPMGGPLNLPIAIPALGLTHVQELAMFAFAIGMFFTMLVFVLIFSRLLFQAPPPQQAMPALLILIAPFSIGYSAYRVVAGHGDMFSQCLFMVDLLLIVVLVPLLVNLPRCCPFRVSWWAVSFPLAAATIAALHFSAASPNWINEGIAILLLAGTSLVVLWLLVRTTHGLLRGELRQLVGA